MDLGYLSNGSCRLVCLLIWMSSRVSCRRVTHVEHSTEFAVEWKAMFTQDSRFGAILNANDMTTVLTYDDTEMTSRVLTVSTHRVDNAARTIRTNTSLLVFPQAFLACLARGPLATLRCCGRDLDVRDDCSAKREQEQDEEQYW